MGEKGRGGAKPSSLQNLMVSKFQASLTMVMDPREKSPTELHGRGWKTEFSSVRKKV